jgi:hypothetical protein
MNSSRGQYLNRKNTFLSINVSMPLMPKTQAVGKAVPSHTLSVRIEEKECWLGIVSMSFNKRGLIR